MRCRFIIDRIGRCSNEALDNAEFCNVHFNKKCSRCGERAESNHAIDGKGTCTEDLCIQCHNNINNMMYEGR